MRDQPALRAYTVNMKTRAQELRERDRRVLRWSLGAAVLIHVAAFVLWPGFRVEDLPDAGEDMKAMHGVEGTPTYVDVVFGPPRIFGPDGTVATEPPTRVLAAERILRLPTECDNLEEPGRTPVEGQVRLKVVASGRTAVAGLEQSTGDACADEVLFTVAQALLYRWLPNDRFPAPVDLIQPVTLTSASS
jgi:hypothetical protein